MFIFYILLISYFIKMILFYHTTETKVFFNNILPASIINFVIFYLLLIPMKYGSEIFMIVYTIISIMLFVDSVYYAHFKKMTSIFLLKNIKLMDVAGDSLPMMIKPYHFLFLLDIPVAFYFNNKFIPLSIGQYVSQSSIFIVSFLVLMIILFNPLKINSFKRLKAQEFLIYHFSDIGIKIAKVLNIYKIEQEDLIKHFKKKEKSNKKKYFGVAKNRNLIVIQIESFQNFLIEKEYRGKEITPNLNKLIKDSLYFNNYYQQIAQGNTSDAEFVTQNSLYPTAYGQTYAMYEKNRFNGLPWIMRENGYNTMAFHGFKKGFWNRENAYPSQGFEKFIGLEDFDVTEKIGIGLSDEEMFKQSIKFLPKDKPFYSFLITLTNHLPYDLPKSKCNMDLFDHHKGTMFGKYINTAHYTDQAIGDFIEKLKKENLYDNSIIALYGDHGGLVPGPSVDKEMAEFLGYTYYYDTLMNIPLIINIPGTNIKDRITKTAGQIDFMPTILNLMGIEKRKVPCFGKDIINNNSGFVATQLYLNKGSFIKDGVCFELSKDGVFENSRAWEIDTRIPVAIEKYRDDYNRAIAEIDMSNYITDRDLVENLCSIK